MCVHMHIYVCARIHMYTYTCVHTYMYTRVYTHVHMCMAAYTHTCVYMYTYTCVHILVRVCVYSYMCAYTHTCVYTYTHTCVYSVTSVVSDSLQPHGLSRPVSAVHGISHVRLLEWGAVSSSRGSSRAGTEPPSPALQADSLPLSHQGSPIHIPMNS